MREGGAFRIAMMIALLCPFFTAAPPGSTDLKPGRYEVTIAYEVQEQRQSPLETVIRCLRRKDFGNPELLFDDHAGAQGKEDESCSIRDWKTGGGRISYEADYPNRSVHVEGSVDASGFSVVRSVTPKAGKVVPLKFMIRGRRTGDCQLMP